MKKFYLLTAFGKDRPGIVAQVTRTVFDLHGNIEDASMTRLGGEFAMMLVVGMPSAAGSSLVKKLGSLQKSLKLTLLARPIATALAHGPRSSPATHLISVYGTDKPGIVYRVAQSLADQRVNITDLNTKTLTRAGKPLYVMLLEVQIPSRAKARSLQHTLKRLGRKLRLEMTLQDMAAISL